MKLILQILLFFFTWLTNPVNATTAFSKVALPKYSVSFPKSENQKLESEVKIGVENFARSGICEKSISKKANLQDSYVSENRAREGNVNAVNGAGGNIFSKLKTEINILSKQVKSHSVFEAEYLAKYPGSSNYPYLTTAAVEDIVVSSNPVGSEIVSIAKIGNFYTVYSFKLNGNIYHANEPSKCEFVKQGTIIPLNIGPVRKNWDVVYFPTATQQVNHDNVGKEHYYFVKIGDSVELRMSRMSLTQTDDGWQLFRKIDHWNRGWLKLKDNCNNSLSAIQQQLAGKYSFLKTPGDHVRVYENGQLVTYNSDGSVKVRTTSSIEFNQALSRLKAGELHDGVATIYQKTSSGYKMYLNYGKDVSVKQGYEENGTAKDKSEQVIEEKLNALLANVPDLEVLRQGAETGVFNDGKKIVIKDLPWYTFAYEIINSGRQFLRDAEIPDNYWNSANANYTPNWLNTPPYVTGVGNGIIEEVKSIPLLIDFGIELATNEPMRTKTWNSMKDLSWQDIKDGLYNQVTSTIDTLSAGNDNSWHSGGKITVEVASMFFGVGFIKKGTEAAKDVISKNIDDIAEEVEDRAAKKLANALDDIPSLIAKWDNLTITEAKSLYSKLSKTDALGSKTVVSQSEILAEINASSSLVNPYNFAHSIDDIVLSQEALFVRVHNSWNPNRPWLISVEDFQKFTSQDDMIKKLALPILDNSGNIVKPAQISIVKVPVGTKVRKSVARPQDWPGQAHQPGGSVQFEIRNNPAIPQSWFKPMGDVSDYLN